MFTYLQNIQLKMLQLPLTALLEQLLDSRYFFDKKKRSP